MAARRSQPGWAEWYPEAGPPRPVEGGLRAKSRRGAIGESWWSRRFLDLLDSFGLGGRLERGRTYARKGQVISLEVEPGQVSAQVQGSRARPYRVRIALPRLGEADWRRAEDAMASRAAFLARLLAGEMPDDIEEAFAGCSAGLFPSAHAELDTDCSCPDWAPTCKHVAAVYFLLAEAFDDDPFLILAWRGRTREELLRNLRALRGTPETAATRNREHDAWAAVEATETPPLADRLEDFWILGAPLAELRLVPNPPQPADAAVRGLDPLDRAVGGRPVEELVRPAYEAITAGALARLRSGDGDAS